MGVGQRGNWVLSKKHIHYDNSLHLRKESFDFIIPTLASKSPLHQQGYAKELEGYRDGGRNSPQGEGVRKSLAGRTVLSVKKEAGIIEGQEYKVRGCHCVAGKKSHTETQQSWGGGERSAGGTEWGPEGSSVVTAFGR